MSKLTESLRAVRVFNGHDFAGHGNVFIAYEPYCSIARTGQKFKVIRSGFMTDPGGHWQDYGHKTFSTFSVGKPEALMAAKAWAESHFGIKEWAKTPYGDWMDAAFVKRRVAELKALVKAKGDEGVG